VKASEADMNRGDALLKVPDPAIRIGVSSDWVYNTVNFDGMSSCRSNARFWRFHWPTVLDCLQKRR